MTESPYSEYPNPEELKKIAADRATASRLCLAVEAEDNEFVAAMLHDVDNARVKSVILAVAAEYVKLTRACAAAGMLRDDTGRPLTAQAYLATVSFDLLDRAQDD